MALLSAALTRQIPWDRIAYTTILHVIPVVSGIIAGSAIGRTLVLLFIA